MNVYQMLKHTTENELLMLEEKTYSRRFIGRIFGKMVLKSILKDEKPLERNSPTHPDLIFTGHGNIDELKEYWKQLVNQYRNKTSDRYQEFVHPFFGSMTKEKIGIFAFKHIDHHLRQFGV